MDLKILVVFNHHILALALARYLHEELGVREATAGEPGRLPESTPDMVLLDPGNCRGEHFEFYPEARFLLVDPGLPEDEVGFLLLSHPLSGILAPDLSPPLFAKAFRTVGEGQIWLPQKHLKSLLKSGGKSAEAIEERRLSPAERRVARLIARGYRNREIAGMLYLSEQTVKAHASRIFKKLQVNSRAQLILKTREG